MTMLYTLSDSLQVLSPGEWTCKYLISVTLTSLCPGVLLPAHLTPCLFLGQTDHKGNYTVEKHSENGSQ